MLMHNIQRWFEKGSGQPGWESKSNEIRYTTSAFWTQRSFSLAAFRREKDSIENVLFCKWLPECPLSFTEIMTWRGIKLTFGDLFIPYFYAFFKKHAPSHQCKSYYRSYEALNEDNWMGIWKQRFEKLFRSSNVNNLHSQWVSQLHQSLETMFSR